MTTRSDSIDLTEQAQKRFTPDALAIIMKHCQAIHDELTALETNVEILINGKTVAFSHDTSFRGLMGDTLVNYVFPPGLIKPV